MSFSRWAGLAAILLAILASIVRFLNGTPSLDAFVRVIVWIFLWMPIKGALLRFLGGDRPYRSALAANATSELIGLGFPLSSLGVPWRALAASTVLSTGTEGVAFGVVGTGRTWMRGLGLALYVNCFVHLLMAGVFLCWPEVLSSETAVIVRQPFLGAAIIFASFLIFILPIFLVPRAPVTDFSRR